MSHLSTNLLLVISWNENKGIRDKLLTSFTGNVIFNPICI